MYSVNEAEDFVDIQFSSKFENVDRVINDTISFIKTFLPDPDENDFKLLLREIVNNSIEHGNKKDEQKNVGVVCEKLENYKYQITVIDEGDGFNLEDIDLKMPEDPAELRSRGLPLVNKIADSLVFNDEGNEISVTYSFKIEGDAKVTSNNNTQEIKIVPEKNITSVSADNLKKELNEVLTKNPEKVIFDFINVKELDSIGLSIIAVFGRMLKDKNSKAVIKIENARMEIIQLFLHTGLDKYFELF